MNRWSLFNIYLFLAMIQINNIHSHTRFCARSYLRCMQLCYFLNQKIQLLQKNPCNMQGFFSGKAQFYQKVNIKHFFNFYITQKLYFLLLL